MQIKLKEDNCKILSKKFCCDQFVKLWFQNSLLNDIPLLSNLLQGVFPGSSIPTIKEPELRENILKVSKKMLLEP
jgi:hypothetical protein